MLLHTGHHPAEERLGLLSVMEQNPMTHMAQSLFQGYLPLRGIVHVSPLSDGVFKIDQA